MARVPPAAIALERLLRRRFELGSLLLNAEMFDRWGPKSGPERDAMMAEAAGAQAEHAKATEALRALAEETWRREPEAVRAWAQAHVALLEGFLATCEGREDRSTAAFVARNEAAAWREVSEGARPFVDENVYYVHLDAKLREEHFGF